MGMKDLLLGLALISCPAIVFAEFGTRGLDAFGDGRASDSSYSVAAEGRLAFAEECAGCHGRLAEGTVRGPALVDPAYAPAQLDDDSFRRAVRQGGAAARYEFGDMPAFPDLPERRTDRMLAFVRALQRARGIR